MGLTDLWHTGSLWHPCRDVSLSLNSLRGLRCSCSHSFLSGLTAASPNSVDTCSFCWPKPAAEFCLDFGTSWFISVPFPFQCDTQTLCKMGNSTLVWEQGCITASEGPEPQQDPHRAALHRVLPPTARCRAGCPRTCALVTLCE